MLETEALPLKGYPDVEMERFRVAVGYRHGVKPGNIVGAIANEAQLESRYIGHIEIFEDFSTVDLPAGMPAPTMRDLRNAWVCQQRLAIERLKPAGPAAGGSVKKGPGRRPDAKARDQKGKAVKRSGRKAEARSAGRKPAAGAPGSGGGNKAGAAGDRPLKRRVTR